MSISLVVALLVGVAAGFGLSEYVRRAEQRAFAQGALSTKFSHIRGPR